jgi:hypothetical protein
VTNKVSISTLFIFATLTLLILSSTGGADSDSFGTSAACIEGIAQHCDVSDTYSFSDRSGNRDVSIDEIDALQKSTAMATEASLRLWRCYRVDYKCCEPSIDHPGFCEVPCIPRDQLCR